MLHRLADVFTRIVQRWLPNAFQIAILLTFVVLLAGILFQGQSPAAMVEYWGDGLWQLLGFSMQMVLILVTGHVFASAPLIRRGLHAAAGVPKSPGQAVVAMTLIAVCVFWINWGFGLIASALVARELARRVEGVHYPLLVASAYSGMVIWHAGLSGSIPLKIAAPDGDSLSLLTGNEAIPISQTILDPANLIICGVLLITLPVINWLMMPPASAVPPLPASVREPEPQPDPVARERLSPAQRLEHSRWLALLLGLLGGWYLVGRISAGIVDLNTVILLFLSAGLILHGNSVDYLVAFEKAVRGIAGILVQYPLYAGIMGMMVGSGLAVSLSDWFVDNSTAQTFPIYTFLSAGIVNFFVPSGGGQWAVQAPIVVPAAESLGVPLDRAAMAVAFGDGWTNMIQPFWALPLLAIAGLGIRDVMGYCAVVLLWSGAVIMTGMALLY